MNTKKRMIQAMISVFGLFFLWEIIARFIVKDFLFLAPPTRIWDALVRSVETGELWKHLLFSGIEFAIGFILAIVLGVGLGLIWGVKPRLDGYLDPIVSAGFSAPLIALAPLFILWFGIGIWSKVAVVFCVAFFPILLNTMEGVRSADKTFVEVVRSFNANERQIFKKVLIPSALPFMLIGIRLGLGRGLNGIVVGELFGATAGVGFMITQASLVFDTATIFLGVLIFIILGVALIEWLKLLENRIAPWKLKKEEE